MFQREKKIAIQICANNLYKAVDAYTWLIGGKHSIRKKWTISVYIVKNKKKTSPYRRAIHCTGEASTPQKLISDTKLHPAFWNEK